MTNKKRIRSGKQKAQIAIAALSKEETINQIASNNKIHTTQIRRWRDKLQNGAEIIFNDSQEKLIKEKNELIEELYKQIGKQKVEIDWLKKNFKIIN